MGVLAERNQELTAPLFLHLLEGMLGEVERMTARAAAAEAELKRVNAKITTLETELAQIRSASLARHEAFPPGRLERFFSLWASLRGGLRPAGMRRE